MGRGSRWVEPGVVLYSCQFPGTLPYHMQLDLIYICTVPEGRVPNS